jgi:hypothetical protein
VNCGFLASFKPMQPYSAVFDFILFVEENFTAIILADVGHFSLICI